MTRRSPDETCRWTRWQLCRLVVGRTLKDEARDLARHVRGCAVCDGFVDDLAALRAFLLAGAGAEPTPEAVAGLARVALARELCARLARDLLAVARSEPGRGRDERRSDLWRLQVLAAETGLSPADTLALERELGGTPVPRARGGLSSRRRLLALATRLDPLGLDVALAWMGHLVRSGQDGQAQRVADRVLSDWNV